MGKYNKASNLLVLDLVNETNTDAQTQVSININTSQVVFGKPVVVEPTVGEPAEGEVKKDWNTELLCTATRSSPYVGSVTLEYDRLDIGKLFKNIAVNLDVKGAKTTLDLVDRLNARYGLGIDKKEVVSAPVAELTTAAPVAHATIEIDATSLAYFGKLDVTVGEDADVGERLNLVVTKTRLDGLHYPVDDTMKGQAYIYSYGVDCNSIRTFLATLATGGVIDDTALAKELNKVVPELWHAGNDAADYNVRGATIKYAGATRDDPSNPSTDKTALEVFENANTNFNTVVVFTLDDTKCTNFAGDLYLHYNA